MLAVNDLKNQTVPELKKALLERGLNVVGKKQDLINRLTAFLQAEAEKQEATESAAPEPVKEVEKPAKPVKNAKPETKIPDAVDSSKENVSC